MDKAVEEFGAQMVFKKINVLKTLQKRTNPEIVKIFAEDLKYVRKEYDYYFKGSWKDSKIFQ